MVVGLSQMRVMKPFIMTPVEIVYETQLMIGQMNTNLNNPSPPQLLLGHDDIGFHPQAVDSQHLQHAHAPEYGRYDKEELVFIVIVSFSHAGKPLAPVFR